MRHFFLFLFLTTLSFATTNKITDLDTIKIGVLAKRGYEVTLKRWNPTADYLHKLIPHKKFKIVPIAFKDIFNVVKNSQIDFILANPGFYVELEYKFGVQRITTLVNKHISGASQKEFGGVVLLQSIADPLVVGRWFGGNFWSMISMLIMI